MASTEILVFSGTLPAAQEVQAALQGHGLEAWLLDGNSSGATLVVSAKVVVRRADGPDATELLKALGLVRNAAGS